MKENFAPSPQVYVGFSAPWNDPGWMTGGIPVLISDDPTWPDDRWALLDDGVVVSSGYGDPIQPQLPRGT
jgi:hypothetical protein